MGYSNETTHYGIPLPTGSDLTTPMDYNESMTDVDVAVFEAKTDSSSALTKAGQLEVALEETNQSVSAIDGRLTEAEGTIVSQGQAITNLNNKIVDLGQDVEDAICSVVEETATAEYEHAVGDYFWYNNTLYITTVAITAGDTIVPNTNCDTVTVATELNKIQKGDVDWIELENVTQSANLLTGLVVKYREINGLLQFLVYATNATGTGYDNLTSTKIASLISAHYTKAGIPSNVAIGFSGGYTVAFLQDANIVLNIATASHYQSTLITL